MNKIFLLIFLFLGILTPCFFILAATGTIDSTYKYAWSNNIGWINFGCEDCNVQVTDSAVTGYLWSNNYGWINLSPTNGGISNNGGGDLSGYAFGQSCGWINFNNVSINTANGHFTGTATGTIVGTINFDCTLSGCPVITDWRPDSTFCGNGVCEEPTENCSNCTVDCGVCGGGSHRECNELKQCISIGSPGVDQCNIDSDCDACDPHGDINKDGSINIVDFSILMYYWEQNNCSASNSYCHCADINKDGVVNLTDFSIMLYYWT